MAAEADSSRSTFIDINQAAGCSAAQHVQGHMALGNKGRNVMDEPMRPSPGQVESSSNAVQLAVRLGLLALVLYWSYVLIRPFVPILVWSAILTVALYPVYHGLSVLLGGRPVLSATLITVLGLAIVIGPASWLVFGLVEGLQLVSKQLGSGDISVPAPNPAVKSWPVIGGRLFDLWDLASTNLAAALGKASPYAKPIASTILAIAGSAGVGILKFLAGVIVAGFLFIPGPRLVTSIRALLSHIVPDRSEEFIALAGSTIRSVSRGIIGIAMLQSLLAGIGFMVAQIPGAGLLSFIVLLLGIAQLGSAILIIPLVVWYWLTHDATAALLFTLYIVPVGLIDNVLKPIVMGHGSKIPMPVILIGVIGGTLAHGILGLFIGPIVLSVGWELLAAWTAEEVDRKGLVQGQAKAEPDALARPQGAPGAIAVP
jgi:predicted PurR-regulated permease PerM